MSSRNKRVTILFDSWNHMMPALAREMARRNHDLVLGDARDDELIKDLRELGAKVEVVPEEDQEVRWERNNPQVKDQLEAI